MFCAILAACLAAAPAPEEKPKEADPVKKELFANEQWYKDQKGKEVEFVGVLIRQADNDLAIRRFKPYCLMIDQTVLVPVQVEREIVQNGRVLKIIETRAVAETQTFAHEVYIDGKPDLLAAYDGKKVKVIGKAVEMNVGGRQHYEIWPARVEIMDKKATPKPSVNDELELMDKAP